jgi:hypothetical protein
MTIGKLQEIVEKKWQIAVCQENRLCNPREHDWKIAAKVV